MSTLQGTTIKNTGYLDKVYFNTSLSTEEVIDILETLDLSKDYFVCTRLAAPQISIWIRKRESYYSIICQRTPYIDMPFNTDPQYVNETAGIVSTGWKTSFDNEGFGNPFEIQDEIDSADYQGNAIGLQNELLKNLISSTPFEAITLDEFLTGIANSIREVKGTTDKINALAFEDEIRGLKGASGSSTPIDNGPIYEGKYRVRYFDVDGTILKIEYVAEGGKTTPPDTPSYNPDYLIFAEWNYDTDNYIVEQPTDIGATYDTVDNVTYMFCRFTTRTGLNPTLAIRGATSIDWGDGTVNTNVSHTYANEGEYIIKIYGDISITAAPSSNRLLGGVNLNRALQKCYIKNSITTIGDYTFYYCQSLTSISIPNSVTSIGTNAFNLCCSLKSITIPEGVTSIGGNVFTSCYGLTSVIIPNGVTSIGEAAFYYCYSLTSITIPEGVTSIGANAFYYCKSLTSITIPEGVTSIGEAAFYDCQSLTNYFIECNTAPTLSDSNAFSNTNLSTIFWVKDSIIEQLKVATNWSTYADYMKPRSWYPSLTNPNA
jgi:hypothetical protein